MERLEDAIVVGATENGDMVIEVSDGHIETVPSKEIGGEQKPNKAFNMIGARVIVTKDGQTYSRSRAMKLISKRIPEIIEGQKIKVRPVVIMEGFMVVEAYGSEIHQKVSDISSYYISDLTEKFSLDSEIDAIVTSVKPFEVSIKKAEEERLQKLMTKYSIGHDWLGEVEADTKMGTFCTITGGTQVLCYKIEWARKPQKGDKVILEIKKIDRETGKMWGAIKKFVKKV